MAEIHQVEGFDTRIRSFNRNVHIRKGEKGFIAQVSYENYTAVTPPFPTPGEAMSELVSILQKHNFTRIRSRINFRGTRYLTESEPWIDY